MSVVTFEQRHNLGLIRLNDPDYHNAFGIDMAIELYDALIQVEQNPSIRCVLITGEGRTFCAGGKFVEQETPRAEDTGVGFLRKYGIPVINAMKNLRCPIVGALNGPALGYGVGLSLMNDITIASKSTYFRLAFAKIGLAADGGATWILPRLIGAKRTTELLMLDDKLWADQAVSWGLVNRVVDDDKLFDEAMRIAQRLAEGPKALTYMRKALWQTWDNSLERQLELEAEMMHLANQTNDYLEGTASFLEKRDPKFTGT